MTAAPKVEAAVTSAGGDIAATTAARQVAQTYRRNRFRETPCRAALNALHTAAGWVATDVDEGVTPTWTLSAFRLARAWYDRAYARSGPDVSVEDMTDRQLFWLNGHRKSRAAL